MKKQIKYIILTFVTLISAFSPWIFKGAGEFREDWAYYDDSLGGVIFVIIQIVISIILLSLKSGYTSIKIAVFGFTTALFSFYCSDQIFGAVGLGYFFIVISHFCLFNIFYLRDNATADYSKQEKTIIELENEIKIAKLKKKLLNMEGDLSQ